MIKKAILILLSIYVLFLVGFYLFQKKLIFQSKKLDKDFSYSFNQNFKEVYLNMSDGAILNALHFKVENPNGVILFFHGNKGNLQRWGNLVQPLTKYGYDVFVMDYRGYGKSTGRQQENAMYSDALEMFTHLNKEYSQDKIVIYGRSLGCTFASYVASKKKPKGLVLEAPFYSLPSLINDKFPLAPYKLLLKFKFNSYRFMNTITCSTLIFHGDKDVLIPTDFGEKLYDKSNKEHTEFVLIKEGTHHNLSTFAMYKEKLKTLLN